MILDNFNVPNRESVENLFTQYSVQGAVHPRSYVHYVRKGDINYSFIAVDATLEVGPRRPFNFVGVLGEHEWNNVQQIAKQVKPKA